MQTAVILADGTRLPATPGSRVAITKQDNDITKVDTVQATYSTTFTLPDNLATKAALEQAQLGTSTTTLPYQEVAGSLEVRGQEVLPRATIQVQGYEKGKGFEVQAFGGNKGFYQAIGDKKLADLALPGSHAWSVGNVGAGLASTGWQDVWAYSILDRGKGVPERAAAGASATPWNIYSGELFPSIYARAIWEQIFLDAGYKWAGVLPAQFDKMELPAVGAYGYSDATRTANTAKLGWQHMSNTRLAWGGTFQTTFPFTYRGPQEPYLAGPGLQQSGDTILITKLGYYRLAATLKVYTGSNLGSTGIRVKIEGYQGGTGPVVQYAQDFLATDSFGDNFDMSAVNVRVLLTPGTRLWVRLEGSDEGSGPLLGEEWHVGHRQNILDPTPPRQFVEPEDTASFAIELLQEFPAGGGITLQDWLPDLAQKDYIKAVIQAFGLTQVPHPYLKVMQFYPTGPTIQASLATAPAWDSRIDAGKPVPVKYQVGSFAQVNWIKWKDDSTNGPENLGLGNGQVLCQDTTLEPTKDLLTLPFAASGRGIDNLPLVAKWQLKPGYAVGDADVEHYETLTPVPRLLLRSATQRRRVTIQDNGNATTTVDAVVSYFASSAEPYDLTFTRLIPTYYQHLVAALKAPRLLRPYVRITPAEGIAFTQLQAIWLEGEGSYFYVNKLDQYEPGQPSTAAELIRLTF